MSNEYITINAERSTVLLVNKVSSILDIKHRKLYKRIEDICEYLLKIKYIKEKCLILTETLFEFISTHVDTSIISSSETLRQAQNLYNQLQTEEVKE